ncbi:hypothetical protein ACFWXH_27305 [Mesorhizobium sp. NPDC059054]|uniref:hypothetical protein n=1 Tax=Mesorhizobium sp. NPDC059054 TaxID=3346711 RepID=UPI00367CE3CF
MSSLNHGRFAARCFKALAAKAQLIADEIAFLRTMVVIYGLEVAMTLFRFTKFGRLCIAVLAWVLIQPFATADTLAAQSDNLHQYCRKAGNDDTVRDYRHDLYRGTVKAFRKLFPEAKDTPDDSSFQTQAQYRCMNGKVMVCFVGANLPCAKMNSTRNNPGADGFCRENPDADFVPLAATGHDAVYSYRCRDGKAEVTDSAWELDGRGFAKKLWIKLPDR